MRWSPFGGGWACVGLPEGAKGLEEAKLCGSLHKGALYVKASANCGTFLTRLNKYDNGISK